MSSERIFGPRLTAVILKILHPFKYPGRPADLCLTGLQISTNQRTTCKQLWGSIHLRVFRETKAFEWFLSSLVRCLFSFAS